MKIKPNIERIPRFMVVNAMFTPDGTFLNSKYRHDYQQHTDKNGKVYILDGGVDDYYRSSCNGDERMFQLFSDSPHEQLREYLGRGGYGKDGKGKYRYTLLKDMTDEHLANAIIYVETHTFPGGEDKWKWTIKLYKKEQRYRKTHNIIIKDETIQIN